MIPSRRAISTRLSLSSSIFFFNDPATSEIYTLSLHDALPILLSVLWLTSENVDRVRYVVVSKIPVTGRSEEHTSELQSHSDLVCRLLLEKKKTIRSVMPSLRSKAISHLGFTTITPA